MPLKSIIRISFRESVRHRAFPTLLACVSISAFLPSALPVRYREPTELIRELSSAPISLWALLFGLVIVQNGGGDWRERRSPLGLPPLGALNLQLASYLGLLAAWGSGFLIIVLAQFSAPFLAGAWRPDLEWSVALGTEVLLRALVAVPGAAALLALANLTEAALGRIVGGVLLVAAFCLSRFLGEESGDDLPSQILMSASWILAPVMPHPANPVTGAVILGYTLTYNLLTALILGRGRGAWPELDGGRKGN
jgi:hypothetical protein